MRILVYEPTFANTRRPAYKEAFGPLHEGQEEQGMDNLCLPGSPYEFDTVCVRADINIIHFPTLHAREFSSLIFIIRPPMRKQKFISKLLSFQDGSTHKNSDL